MEKRCSRLRRLALMVFSSLRLWPPLDGRRRSTGTDFQKRCSRLRRLALFFLLSSGGHRCRAPAGDGPKKVQTNDAPVYAVWHFLLFASSGDRRRRGARRGPTLKVSSQSTPVHPVGPLVDLLYDLLYDPYMTPYMTHI